MAEDKRVGANRRRRVAALLDGLDSTAFMPVARHGDWPLRFAFQRAGIAGLVDIFAVEVAPDEPRTPGIAMRRLFAHRPLRVPWGDDEPLRLVVGVALPDAVLGLDAPILVVAERQQVRWNAVGRGPRLPLQALLDAARLDLARARTPAGQTLLCVRVARMAELVSTMLHGLDPCDLIPAGFGCLASRANEAEQRAAAAFDARVVRAYGGRCALCGVDMGSVSAVRIRPVPGSATRGDVRDGIAMCGLHTAAFGHHRFAVDPGYGVHANATERPGDTLTRCERGFLASLPTRIRLPLAPADAPAPHYLAERLLYFDEAYAWLHGSAEPHHGAVIS